MTRGRPWRSTTDVQDTGFRGLADEELGPTPPAPADRLEWVLRAAGSARPPSPPRRLPRRGYLALAVALLSTSLVAGLVLDARLGAGEGMAGDTGDTGPIAVTDSVPRLTGHPPMTRLGPAISASPHRSPHRSPRRSSQRPTHRPERVDTPAPVAAPTRLGTRPPTGRPPTTSRPAPSASATPPNPPGTTSAPTPPSTTPTSPSPSPTTGHTTGTTTATSSGPTPPPTKRPAQT